MNKLKCIAAGLILALGLSACAQEEVFVSVERVDRLTAVATAAEKFSGVVVSDNAVTVAKEADKKVKELLVKEGDQVREGQKLFSYDTDELNLTLDKQELEQDRLEAEIDDIEDQIKDVEAELKNASGDTKTQLNIQLRQLEMELTQAEYDGNVIKTEIEYTKKMLKNVHVYSPIDGTVRSVSEDNYEQYLVIQQTGAYRVKGLLNEMNMGMGIMEGTAVQVISRLDPSQVWTGTVELVDYENAEQNSYDSMYYGYSSSMSSSSSYPFYITLDSTDGLLLGQHVYIQIAVTVTDPTVPYIPESYLMDLLYDSASDAVTASVWMVNEKGVLTKQAVTLGEYDMATGSYQVIEGLDFVDYVADPSNPDCREGAAISINGQTGYTDNSGLTPAEQESVSAEIADFVENAGE